jgi:hypothetical protein
VLSGRFLAYEDRADAAVARGPGVEVVVDHVPRLLLVATDLMTSSGGLMMKETWIKITANFGSETAR